MLLLVDYDETFRSGKPCSFLRTQMLKATPKSGFFIYLFYTAKKPCEQLEAVL
ncbi:Uncharacterised protein [Oligella urethralis]|nr:Uncharacterised protein [Oligella urethralis]